MPRCIPWEFSPQNSKQAFPFVLCRSGWKIFFSLNWRASYVPGKSEFKDGKGAWITATFWFHAPYSDRTVVSLMKGLLEGKSSNQMEDISLHCSWITVDTKGLGNVCVLFACHVMLSLKGRLIYWCHLKEMGLWYYRALDRSKTSKTLHFYYAGKFFWTRQWWLWGHNW